MAHLAGSCCPPHHSASLSAELLSEIESLKRERNELRELVRQQEVDLSPRAGGQGPGAGGRARSLERRLDLERLLTAQETTATSHPATLWTATVKASGSRTPLLAPRSPRRCRCSEAGLPTSTSTPRLGLPESRSCSCSAMPSRRSASTRASGGRRSPSASFAPSVGASGMPRGSGRRGPGNPEGRGSGSKRPASCLARPPSPPRPPYRSAQPSKQPLGSDLQATRSLGAAPSTHDVGLEDMLGEALRGLGGARGALAEAAKQLSQEAHRRSSEAWRLHRLEQVMAASLGGFSRELQALRAESVRSRGSSGLRPRCRSCTRC